MLMYKCCNCHTVFDPIDVKHYREDYGETFAGCPECLSDFEEVEVCANCGAVMSTDFVPGQDICPVCGEVVI